MGDSASLSPSCSSHPGNTGVLAVENKETKRLYLTRSSSDLKISKLIESAIHNPMVLP